MSSLVLSVHCLVRMEWRPARWSVCLPLLIFPCTIKSRSSLLAPAHLGGPRKRAIKRLWWRCDMLSGWKEHLSRLLVLLPRILLTTIIFYAGRRPLRSHSNDIRKLIVPRTHNKLGDRSFSAAGPRLWNDLPPGLRRPGLSFDSFRRSLKTHLFTN